ncbi:MAG: condensation domain-containing protein [Acidimicrobiales bacterium]
MSEPSSARQRLLEQRLAARPRGPSPRRSTDPDAAQRSGAAVRRAGGAALRAPARPDRAAYNVVHAYHLHGALDLDRLGDAIRAAAAGHEPLRHSFGPDRRALGESEAIQVVEVAADEPASPPSRSAQAVERFDLERGPLLRATLCRLSAEHVGLVLAVHHVSSDAAPLTQLWRDIDERYQGAEPVELPVRYSDHAVWQAAQRSEEDLRYWLDHLGPAPTAVSLPYPTPTVAGPDGYRTIPSVWAPTSLSALGWRSTPFFLAVLAAHLQRGTDTGDVVVGLAASTRDHPSVDRLVGYFLNVLPLRLAVDPAADAAALVAAAERALAGGLAHRRVPYAEIANALRRRGDAEHDPARVMFVAEDAHDPQLAGCTVTGELVHNGCAVTDLTASSAAAATGSSCRWNGTAAATRPRTSSGPCPTWPPWPGGPSATPTSRCWPPRRGRPDRRRAAPAAAAPARAPRPRAAEQPGSTAVSCGDEQVTYAQLAGRVAAASALLAARGCGAGPRRGAAGAIGGPGGGRARRPMAGRRLRADRPRLPRRPHPPDHRTGRVAGHGRPADRSAAGRRRDGDPPRRAGDGTVVGCAPVATLDDPAYVIFTSGSTGVPRCAGGAAPAGRQHAGPFRGLRRRAAALPGGVELRVRQLRRRGVLDLAAGGELVIPTEAEVHDVDALVDLVARRSVTHLLMVPTLYAALLARRRWPALGLAVRHRGR